MMTFQLRRFYRPIAQAALILGFSGLVHAVCPDKPIKLFVPYPPGGATDVIGRNLAKNLGESLGQQVLVENQSGVGGNIGAEAVAKATPDGYTLLMDAVTSHSTIKT
jgi:tripartite-type tricarboxylate transporter receptor subunit TctC